MSPIDNDSRTTYYQEVKRGSSIIIAGKVSEPITVLHIDGDKTIGRKSDAGTADIQLESQIVSKNHGIFSVDKSTGVCFYKDTKSLNGTSVNGYKLPIVDETGSNWVQLNDGDILRIDRANLNCPHPEAITIIYSDTIDPTTSWRKLALTKEKPLVIGREATGGIALDQSYISQNHARIYCDASGRYFIQNCDSRNGITVNTIPVQTFMELHDRNVIRICDTLMFFMDGMLIFNAVKATGNGLMVHIEETSVADGLKKKVLLENINVNVENGDFVLILGGSGAGKSTLVNSILGKYKIKGSISMENGTNKNDVSDRVQDHIGYVPQTLPLRKEERLIDVITDTAILRSNEKMGPFKRRKKVMETLEMLGLGAKAKMQVKMLSGGEQRRAAIANEAVTDPAIFFLDEPDSGLDPRSGYELMQNLKTFSENGKIVMLISHNYASYANPENIYTKVLVLAKSNTDGIGKLAYFGSIKDAFTFFGVSELKDITRVINPKSENGEGRADEFVEKFRRIQGI